MTGLALIAGSGRLPAILAGHLAAQGRGPKVLSLAGHPPAGLHSTPFRIEHLGTVLARLPAEGVREVVFAGSVRRPPVDPAALDEATAPLVPGLLAAMGRGDDHLLRAVIGLFEAAGMAVRGAAELMPELVLAAGPLTGASTDRQRADAVQARAILDALGPLDLGQAAVVARGHCLGIETIQGTEALLDFVARTRPGSGGVLAKRPKPGQDLRIDMPAIGPDTVDQASAAGLSAIAVAAGGVMVLDRKEVVARAALAGMAIWAEP